MKLFAHSVLGGESDSATDVLSCRGLLLTERSDLGAVYLVAREPLAPIEFCLGGSLPTPGSFISLGGTSDIASVAPRHWIIACARSDELRLVDELTNAVSETGLAVAFGDELPWLDLAGDAAESCLLQGGFMRLDGRSFAVGAARRLLLAGIPIVLCRISSTRWRIGVERSRARHFRDWLASTEIK